MSPLAAGDQLGRYRIVRPLGAGAMGEVYLAEDPQIERQLAIKTVRIENLNDQELAEYEARFTIEARSAARMQHPNIVGVYDSGRDGDLAYLVMEYVEGQDLKHHMDQGARYTLAESLAMTRDLLDALDYSHL
ncbi:MAG TPA: serine/threonine-protein kinase, partial [Thermoanaerobaculia bacterium]|nr:serine/threonine-protein kinase [Thermoanaerobaculia bacterium]